LEFSTFGHFSADDSMNWNLQFSFHSLPHGTGLSIVNLLLDATSLRMVHSYWFNCRVTPLKALWLL
jgi:hypothetical protein